MDELANVKPGVYNVIIVTLMVIVGLNLMKFIFNKFPIPGFTDLVNNA